MKACMNGTQKTIRFVGVGGGDVVYTHKVMQQNKQRLGYGLLTIPLSSGVVVVMELHTQNNETITTLYKHDYSPLHYTNTHKYTPTIRTLSRIIADVVNDAELHTVAYKRQYIVCAECFCSDAEKCYCNDCLACCKFTYFSDYADIDDAYKHIEQHHQQYEYCGNCYECLECCIGWCYE